MQNYIDNYNLDNYYYGYIKLYNTYYVYTKSNIELSGQWVDFTIAA